ncbi:unnamed protein product [Sphagnum jensenii]
MERHGCLINNGSQPGRTVGAGFGTWNEGHGIGNRRQGRVTRHAAVLDTSVTVRGYEKLPERSRRFRPYCVTGTLVGFRWMISCRVVSTLETSKFDRRRCKPTTRFAENGRLVRGIDKSVREPCLFLEPLGTLAEKLARDVVIGRRECMRRESDNGLSPSRAILRVQSGARVYPGACDDLPLRGDRRRIRRQGRRSEA